MRGPSLLPTHSLSRASQRRKKGRSFALPLLVLLLLAAVGYFLYAGRVAKRVASSSTKPRDLSDQVEDTAYGSGAQAHGIRGGQRAPAHNANRAEHLKKESQEPLPYLRKEADPDVRQHEGDLAKAPTEAVPQGLFARTALDIDGQTVSLSRYAGKVLIVVNVASACGYTDQNYAGLQKVYEKYKEYGLEVLGFPCNQFGGQESGTELEIKAFCTGKYHVTFPMFSKIEVNGPGMHPVYQFLRRELPAEQGGGGGQGFGKDIGWNFFKFVVSPKGMPVKLLPQNFDQAAVEEAVLQLLDYKPRSISGDAERRLAEEASVRDATARDGQVQAPPQAASEAVPQGLFALTALDIDGQTVSLSRYAGKVLIVVNVASACGYTDQNYAGLQKVYEKYKEYGLEVLGFPCNQFGGQESGTELEIKIEVNGPGMHPVYQFLRRELPAEQGGGGGQGFGKDIGWNFFKFAVNKKGMPVKLWPQTFDIVSLEQMIYRLLHE